MNRDRTLLDRIALVLVALFARRQCSTTGQAYLLSAIGERAVAGLRRELFAKLLEMPPGFFADRRTGELTSRLTMDVGLLQGVLSHQVAEFSRQVLSLVGGIVLLTVIQPKLTLTALAVASDRGGNRALLRPAATAMTTGVQDQVAEATAVAEEAFSQIRTVQSFVQEPAERARYGDRIRRASRPRSGALRFVECSSGAHLLHFRRDRRRALAGRPPRAGREAHCRGRWSGSCCTPSRSRRRSARSPPASASYQEAVGAAERVFELLESAGHRGSRQSGAAPDAGARARRVRAGVLPLPGPDAPWTLDDSLRVAPGEVVALVGPSGGGKTTLVSLLPRFWDVTAGGSCSTGATFARLRLADLRGAIGVVPQEPALFGGTVRENIAYARPERPEAEIEAAARAAHAHEFVERLPEGYDTLVGERGVKLSAASGSGSRSPGRSSRIRRC